MIKLIMMVTSKERESERASTRVYLKKLLGMTLYYYLGAQPVDRCHHRGGDRWLAVVVGGPGDKVDIEVF